MLGSKSCTDHFPSMDPSTIALHFDYKHNGHGSHLLKEEVTLVLDCEGKHLLCSRKRKYLGNKEQCSLAISKVRANYGQQGPF